MSDPAWQICTDDRELAQTAAITILSHAARACRERGSFHIILPGGRTPAATFALLRQAEVDWSEWQVYFGDERCLPAGHPERNDSVARNTWLDHVRIPADQVHAIPAELGAEHAAAAYAAVVDGVERFDLVLLGLGEDGHTASLFPGHDLGDRPDAPAVLAVHDAPKPPSDRVSLSARTLSRCRCGLLLISGAGKRNAVTRWRAGADFPIARLRPGDGLRVLVTREASGE